MAAKYEATPELVLPLQVIISADDHLDDQKAQYPPLVFSYNNRIRPLLDAVDKLRRLKVTQEGIQLPTIVVVGDQSSGKSSVLESLAGISLPRGQGICTRVPLVMRLQHHPNPSPELHLEFNGKTVPIDETQVSEAIKHATDEIAGNGKGISNKPLTLVVKKNGVPDLTMVDLPGITRVAVHGQPEDIYEQISDIIMEYIKPEECIILNVLSATVDFPTCESVRMSQRVDKTGQRTLAVVTKADMAPEGLLEKVMADDVNIGLGYVCVRNRVGDETYDEARMKEASLFADHKLLSKIDKSMVTVPVLAQRLVEIQSTIISKCLPNIVRQIDEKLNVNVTELNKMPRNLSTVADAMAAFLQIVGSSKESLRKILIRGEFDEYANEKEMHGTTRLAEMLSEFWQQLQDSAASKFGENFLVEEIKVLEEAKGIWLPNFLPHAAFMILLQKNVNEISQMPACFVAKVWDYIETVVVRILMRDSENYPQLISPTRRVAQNLVGKMKEKFTERVVEMVEMEKLTDYTCDPNYLVSYNQQMASHSTLVDLMKKANRYGADEEIEVEGHGLVEVGHLRKFAADTRDQAFDLKMRMSSYWEIVLKRLVDWIALQLQFTIQNLVNKELEMEIVNEVMACGGVESMLEEFPSVAIKREKLSRSISLLKGSKDVVARVMDRIAIINE